MEQNRSTHDPATAGAPAATAATKADLGKRTVAFLIDWVIGAVIGMLVPVIGWLLSSAYWLVRDGLDVDFMKGRSLGKKVMKLRPVRLDGGPMNLETSVRRNWPLAVGGLAALLANLPVLGWLLALPIVLIATAIFVIEVVLVLTDAEGRRLGDRTGPTKIVESMD